MTTVFADIGVGDTIIISSGRVVSISTLRAAKVVKVTKTRIIIKAVGRLDAVFRTKDGVASGGNAYSRKYGARIATVSVGIPGELVCSVDRLMTVDEMMDIQAAAKIERMRTQILSLITKIDASDIDDVSLEDLANAARLLGLL